MLTSGNELNLLLYIQSIIWFILAGYLIYLIIKNKLTYVDKFRQKIVFGIVFEIIIIGSILIFQVILQARQELLIISYSIMFAGLLVYIALTLLGISNLINYISSIIDFETKNKKKFALIISTIITASLAITYFILRLNNAALLIYLPMMMISWFIVYSVTIYTLLLHQEMKKIDLNILLYFALSYFCIALILLPGLFLDPGTDMLFWVFSLSFFTVLNIFLIIGYLDFKNKINRVSVK